MNNTQRFKALDVLRGMTVCFMIIVNTPGNYGTTFSFLLHASWHGFTPTDLVFPSFLFAVGNALAFVMPKWQTWTDRQVYLKVVKRAGIIFLLGYLMYWFPFMKWSTDGELISFPFSQTRVFGVLQRIALCYLFAVPLIRYFNTKQLVWVSSVMLLSYWLMTALLGDYEKDNFGAAVDSWLLSDGHLYHGYGYPFDPEGLLSTLPAIVNVIGGYLAGWYLRQKVDYEKLSKMLLLGCLLVVVALVWDVTFPINKSLWTSSFVLLTVGLDLILLSCIIYLMEFSKRRVSFRFFDPFGKNPLFIYLLSEYLAITLHFIRVSENQSLFSYIFQHGFAWMSPYLGSLTFALTFAAICWSVAKWMDSRKIYIKV
ncbi:MAG: DUF1624 domain-containing protein [Cyclobacteriaceae bacterium]|nr:DUF1624 domain-containing protein [Cyclobacteriaceae bacterium HetDA_MAG_MS6]